MGAAQVGERAGGREGVEGDGPAGCCRGGGGGGEEVRGERRRGPK